MFEIRKNVSSYLFGNSQGIWLQTKSIFTSDGSGLRFFGLGRARALRCRARVGLGPGPIMKLLVGRARAFHFRARVGLGPRSNSTKTLR